MKTFTSDKNPTIQAYGELQTAFEYYNIALFNGLLPYCLITMQREKRTYGYFSSHRFANREKVMIDEIALNPSYFGVVPLLEILQTIVHEMTHAWQYHFGTPSRRGYHNKEWADKMETIGLMPSNTGKPGGKKTGEKMADYAINGGLFMQATETLLKTDFSITWFDRYPPAGMQIASIDALENEIGEIIQPSIINKSNREKYRCPHCLIQVWGKPDLKLLCGNENCNAIPFEIVK